MNEPLLLRGISLRGSLPAALLVLAGLRLAGQQQPGACRARWGRLGQEEEPGNMCAWEIRRAARRAEGKYGVLWGCTAREDWVKTRGFAGGRGEPKGFGNRCWEAKRRGEQQRPVPSQRAKLQSWVCSWRASSWSGVLR